MSEPTDFTGRVIKPGDLVAYPVRQGGGMWLSSARVNSITVRDGRHVVDAQSHRQRVTLKHTARLIVIDE